MSVSAPVGEYFSNFPIHPAYRASGNRDYFVASLATIIKCLLFTSTNDINAYFTILDEFLQGIPEVDLTLDVGVDGTVQQGQNTDIIRDADVYSNQDLLNIYSLELVYIYLSGESLASVNYSFMANIEYVRDEVTDTRLVGYLLKLISFSPPDSWFSARNSRLDSLWRRLANEPLLLCGRGVQSRTLDDFNELKTSLLALDHERVFVGFALKNMAEGTELNFSLGSIVSGIKTAFNYVDFAKDLAMGAYSTFFGNPPAIVTTASQAFDKLNDTVQKFKVRDKLRDNIRRSELSSTYEDMSAGEIAVQQHKVAPLLAFYKGFKDDDSFHVNVGANDQANRLTSQERIAKDKDAMKMLELAKNIMKHEVPNNALSLTQTFNATEHLFRVARDAYSGRGRAVGTDAGVSFENFWLERRGPIITELTEGDDEDLDMIALLSTASPYSLSVLDNQGDIVDSKDVRDFQTQIANLNSQISELLVTQVVSTSMSKYQNWNMSTQLAAHVGGQWANVEDALEMVNGLVNAGFKYNTVRDSARDTIQASFPIKLSISENVRFPEASIVVCRSSGEVSAAINDVLAALNYRDHSDTVGAVAGSTSVKKGAQGVDLIRATSEYNDASLNYTSSLEKLGRSIAKNTYDRTKFERRFGLFWQ